MATEARRREAETRASRFRLAARDESLSLALVVAGTFVLAIVVRYLLAREIVTPWIMGDELIYSEMAKSFADGGHFLFRDAASHLNNVVYPALIAPAWRAESIETAYGIARAINVVLMASAAVPVYLWGRRLMSTPYALLAAVLVLLMPSLLYTGTLMTENAFFPAVVATCFAIAVALERPTLRNQALALTAIGLTFAVRPQGLVLLPVYLAALALKLVFDLRAPGGPRGLRYVLAELRRYLASGAALVVLAVGYVAFNAYQGVGLESALGAYGGVVKVEYDVNTAASWVVDHFAEMFLSVGLVPASALIVVFGLALRGWASTAAERAFVAVATTAVVLMVTEVGIFASRFSYRIEERNMFSVAPVLFLALSLWIARGAPRPLLLTAAAAAVPAALLFSLDLRSLLNVSILSDTFGLIPLLRLANTIDGGVDRVQLVLRLGGIVTAVAFAVVPRRVAVAALPALVGVFLVVSSNWVLTSIRGHADATLGLMETPDPSWIDDRIGTEAQAAFLYGGTSDLFSEAQLMWQTEFWNRSVGPIYTIGAPDPAYLVGTTPATFDALTGRLVPASRTTAPRAQYVVAPSTLTLAGRRLAQEGRLVLYRAPSPLRLATHLGGIYSDSWMGSFAALTHYSRPSRPGWIRVRISREAWGGPTPPGEVTIRLGRLGAVDGGPGITTVTAAERWTVQSGRARSFTLPTPTFPYRLEIHVDPTFSPADYGFSDARQLGAQVELSS